MSVESVGGRCAASGAAYRAVAAFFLAALASCVDGPVDPIAAVCDRRAPLSLAVGDVAEPPDLVAGGVCVEAVGPADYVVVATVTPAGQSIEVDVLGSGFTAGSEDLMATPMSAPARAADRPTTGPTGSATLAPDEGLREAEIAELTPRIRARAPSDESPAVSGRPTKAPMVGGLEQYPTAVSCSADPGLRQGRVVAVAAHAVVLVDVAAPAPGFSDAELQAFASFFDDSVYPVLTDAFGHPSDIDGNDRIVIFFTPAANALSPRSSGTVVGGFFWAGHLFPALEGSGSRLAPCAASAESEILYMSVPDPLGSVAAPISAGALQTEAVLAHEFQHLLSSSRRLHVSAANDLEETWLNEGLSYIAEEMLFYETTGLAPKENLGGQDLVQLGVVEAFNRFAYGNVGRYNVFLQGPHFHSALGVDGIETRGAAWSYLRYVLDHSATPEQVLRSLLGATVTGLDNLEAAAARDPLDLMAEWAVSLVADDLSSAVPDTRFQQASWDLKSIIPDLRADHRYPLSVIGIPPDQGVRFTLRSGGAGFGSFQLDAGGRASLSVQAAREGASVRAFLVRVR